MVSVLQFFVKAMDILYVRHCHGSEVIFHWSRKFEEGRTRKGNGRFG